MGLAALRKILEPRPLALDEVRGRAVAVDADNLLWAFVTAFAPGEQPRAPDGRPIGHLLGLVNRLRFYADLGVRSAWVYDGEQPALKQGTLADREARIQAAGSVSLTPQQLAESKELLSALGVPWTVAPGESDAQCAMMARRGDAWAAVTQDYDAALHASPRTLRNLSISKTRAPEMLDLAESLARAGLTREQLVDAAILIGTDYNAGVKGVGPVKAVKLVRERGGLHGALAALGVEMPEADEVRRLFLEHPVDEAWRPAWRAPDAARVADVLAGAGLSEKRARDASDALARLHGVA